MERLIDFLDHGLLPFTGRNAHVDRIVAFWRATYDAHELRAALLSGEAGIGKSRLLAETLPGITSAGGAVIHAKLVPESTSSPLALIAQGLWYSEAARRLIRREPEPTQAAVAGALRRISRLRPTLLVLEDIHLLSGDPLREFSALVEAIASETISLLCLARPVELPARGVLERFVVEEIELGGLDAVELEELWARLFGEPAEPEVVARIREATGGNPLAIRSTLRSAVRSMAIAPDPASGRWRPALPPASFGKLLRRNVDLLVEGMAVHLSDDERRAAARLASLGEIFSRESARALDAASEAMIESLSFKGIIAQAAAATPLLGGTHEPAYTFTHTLLHQHLVSSDTPPLVELVHVIARRLPLYSALPFQIISRYDVPPSMPPSTAIDAVRAAIEVSRMLAAGPDWMLAAEIVRTGWHLFGAVCAELAPEDAALLEASLLSRTLNSLVRSSDGEALDRHLSRMLEITAPPVSGALAPFRLRALHHLHLRTADTGYERCADVWMQVEELLERHPELFGSEAHSQYLKEVARAAQRVPDATMLRRVEERLECIMASSDLPASLRETARQQVAPSLLLLFESSEELERRMALLRDLPTRIDGSNAALELNRIALLETTGWMAEALGAATRGAARFQEIGLSRNAAHVELIALCARAALGCDLDGITDDAIRLGGEPGYRSTPAFRRTIGIYLTEIGFFCGELGWTRAITGEFGSDAAAFWPEGALLLAIEEGKVADVLATIEADEEPLLSLVRLGAALFVDPEPERAATAARQLMARPFLRIDDVILLRTTLAMLEAAGPARPAGIEADVRAAMARALTWLEERRLARPMASLLDRHAGFLSKKETSSWRARLRPLASPPAGEAGLSAKLRVTMLGTIAVSGADGTVQQLRGARLRTMLGLLVAARMVREPLTNREFCRLAAGGEADPDLARKTAIMAAARLREAIGGDAVLTGEETYMLNLDRISVDLLEAHELIGDVYEALRRRALMRAYPALVRALEITRGEVPFPGLYDDFFEAIRDDFDFTIRTAVIDVARALLLESDTASAGEILRLAFDGTPDDEEIAELLRQTLSAAGRRTEAERARMRAEEVLEPEEPI